MTAVNPSAAGVLEVMASQLVHAVKSGDTAAVQEILDLGCCSPDAVLDANGTTALMFACQHNYPVLVQVLWGNTGLVGCLKRGIERGRCELMCVCVGAVKNGPGGVSL